MALSSPGLGSGLDINGLVTQMMTVERRPVTVLDKKEASYQAQLSAFGMLKGALSSLQTATKTLTTAANFSPRKATVADTAYYTATTTSAAAPASYDVIVESLSKPHQLGTGSSFATSTAGVGGGTLSIAAGGTIKTITVDSTNNTLAGVRDAINNAQAGVTATIVTGKIGGVESAQLLVTSTLSGAANLVSVSNPGGGLELLTGALAEVQPGTDAKLTVNGVEVSSASNTVTSAIDGVTLNLVKADPAKPIALTIARDPNNVKSNVDAFVKAYNDVVKTVKDLSGYDAAAKKGGILIGDAAVRGVQTQLRKIMGSMFPGSGDGLQSLPDIGISFQKDGTLSLDAGKFVGHLEDPRKNVGALFATAETGIAVQLDAMLSTIVSTSGMISARTEGISNSVKQIGKRREVLEARMVLVEKRLRTQFSALDGTVASMNQTSSFLQQQLANLSRVSSGG